MTNSAAFRSSSAQTTSNLIKDQGDPGAYEPHIFLSLAKQASSSWNRRVTGACAAAFVLLTRTQSMLSWSLLPVFPRAFADGHVAFGALQKRVLDMRKENWNEGEKTPGPAAYKVEVDEKGREWQMSTMATGERMKSATFASTTAQRGDFLLPGAVDIPGPGAYTPNDAITIPHLPGANPDTNIVSKVGRASRYVADSMVSNNGAAGPEVGPGTYEAHLIGTIKKEVRAAPPLHFRPPRSLVTMRCTAHCHALCASPV